MEKITSLEFFLVAQDVHGMLLKYSVRLPKDSRECTSHCLRTLDTDSMPELGDSDSSHDSKKNLNKRNATGCFFFSQ